VLSICEVGFGGVFRVQWSWFQKDALSNGSGTITNPLIWLPTLKLFPIRLAINPPCESAWFLLKYCWIARVYEYTHDFHNIGYNLDKPLHVPLCIDSLWSLARCVHHWRCCLVIRASTWCHNWLHRSSLVLFQAFPCIFFSLEEYPFWFFVLQNYFNMPNLHVPTCINGLMNLEYVRSLAMVSTCGRGGCPQFSSCKRKGYTREIYSSHDFLEWQQMFQS